MHGGSRGVDLLDSIIDKEISYQEDSSDGLSAEDKEEISNLYMEVRFFLQRRFRSLFCLSILFFPIF